MLILIQFLVILTVTSAQLTWRRLGTNNTVAPEGRRDHAMGFDSAKNRVIVFGGRGSRVYGDTWSYSLTNNAWTKIGVNATGPQNRFSTVYGVSNGYFYVSTGQEASNLYNDIWRFSLVTDTWQELIPSGTKPGTIYGAVGGFYSSTSTKFYVSHGFSKAVRFANTLCYDTVSNKWAEIYGDKSSYTPNHPNARCLGSGCMVAEDELVLYGGCLSGGKTGGACPAFDSWMLSTSKKSWDHLEDCASPRIYSSLALLPEVGGQKRAVLYGGGESNDEVLTVDKAEKDQIAILNVNTEKWTLKRASGDSPGKRVGAAMISHPQGLIMFGGSGFNDIWMLVGDSKESDKTPKHSQSCNTPFSGTLNLIMLHGVFMIIGWGILLQGGAFIARYFRYKDPLWFHLHRIFQVSGLLFAIAGLICAVESVRFDHFKFAHAGLGLFIMIIGLLQPLNAIIRPHKEPADITLKRKIWEFSHINLGRFALIAAVINISLGLFQAQAFNAHHAVWYVYVGLFVLAYIVMEIKKRYTEHNAAESSFEMR